MLQAGFNNPWSVNLSTNGNDVTMFKTQVEPRAAVSLQSFEHFDVISIVDKSTDHRKLLSICFSQ